MDEPGAPEDRGTRVERLDLRRLTPHVRFGTASDRYAGWIGSVYPESFADRVQSRSRKLGGDTYEERTVPIDSVRHYFEHFDVLELDFTFYRPLLDADGAATPNWFVLQRYADHAPSDASFLLKAPQAFFARILRRGHGYEPNPGFLDAEGCRRRFLDPARDLLGDRLRGVVFEQEYQRKKESPSPEDNVAELDPFFAQLDGDVQAHVELRSPHLLEPPFFDWLEARGIGQVFSHWTWLPPLRAQWSAAGQRFTAANRDAVVRLLTPLRTSYADAYALAHPFDRAVPELSETPQAASMVADAAMLALEAEARKACVVIVANNRAWGNAPALAQAVARRVLDEEARRGG